MMKPLAAWQSWLPQGRRRALTEDDFSWPQAMSMINYEQLRTIEGYEKRLAEHKEGLRVIEDQAMTLWY